MHNVHLFWVHNSVIADMLMQQLKTIKTKSQNIQLEYLSKIEIDIYSKVWNWKTTIDEFAAVYSN